MFTWMRKAWFSNRFQFKSFHEVMSQQLIWRLAICRVYLLTSIFKWVAVTWECWESTNIIVPEMTVRRYFLCNPPGALKNYDHELKQAEKREKKSHGFFIYNHRNTLVKYISGWVKQKAPLQICIITTSSYGNISALLAICAGNSPVTGEFSAQRPVMRSFDVFFDLRLNKRLSKQSWGWWFETPWRSLWRHCNDKFIW